MTATADLRSEHVGVSKMLGIMDSMAARARQGQSPESDDLSQVIEFLRVFVDRCHHTKEEQLLFPAIRAAGMKLEPTISRLLADHVRGRETVTLIAAAAEQLEAGDTSANALLDEAMTGYTQLLRAHILEEERDCFGAADCELPVVAQEELVEGYERIESEVVGRGVHEGFHALLERLSLEYT